MMRNYSNSSFGTSPQSRKPLPTFSALFGLVGFLAFCSNLLLCMVIMKKRSMLKKPYNILIFNLAITDLLTGVFILATPNHIVRTSQYPSVYGTSAWIFCKLIASKYFLFVFGKASTLAIMCLAIERWYSITKPMQYKCTFSRPRLCQYLALIWVGCLASQSWHLFETKPNNGRCTSTPLQVDIDKALIVTNVAVTFIIPSVVTWVTFAHIWIRLRKSPAIRGTRRGLAQARLLRMCALAALLLTVCWLPSQSALMLSRFRIIPERYKERFIFLILAFSNSFVNPWLYCLSNQEYREEFLKLFHLKKRKPVARKMITMMGLSKSDMYQVSGNDNRTYDESL